MKAGYFPLQLDTIPLDFALLTNDDESRKSKGFEDSQMQPFKEPAGFNLLEIKQTKTVKIPTTLFELLSHCPLN